MQNYEAEKSVLQTYAMSLYVEECTIIHVVHTKTLSFANLFFIINIKEKYFHQMMLHTIQFILHVTLAS